MFTDTYLDRTAGVFDMRVATDCYVCKSHKRWRHRSMCGSHLHPRADICAVASQAPLPSCPSPSPCPLSPLARGVGTRGGGSEHSFCCVIILCVLQILEARPRHLAHSSVDCGCEMRRGGEVYKHRGTRLPHT